MRKQAESWLKSAQDDLLVIKEIINNNQLTHIIAFHAQQAIEKSLKAVLEENTEEVPRIHNLITLKNIADQYIELVIDNDYFDQINELYIDSRYPTDFGYLPDGKPTVDEAVRFKETAESVYDQIKKKI